LEELARDSVDFVIVGGYAVAFHGHPRATKDIDGQAPLRVDFLRTIEAVTPEDLFARAAAGVIDGLPLKVISLDDLITNKRAAGRPQDLVDAQVLERIRQNG
jgi:predicted nucleotidyltransferase